MEDERLYRSPSNAVRPPPGTDRKNGHAGYYLVLARLVFGHRTHIIPATVHWTSDDRVLIAWSSRPGGPERHTWLLKADVRSRIVY